MTPGAESSSEKGVTDNADDDRDDDDDGGDAILGLLSD